MFSAVSVQPPGLIVLLSSVSYRHSKQTWQRDRDSAGRVAEPPPPQACEKKSASCLMSPMLNMSHAFPSVALNGDRPLKLSGTALQLTPVTH